MVAEVDAANPKNDESEFEDTFDHSRRYLNAYSALNLFILIDIGLNASSEHIYFPPPMYPLILHATTQLCLWGVIAIHIFKTLPYSIGLTGVVFGKIWKPLLVFFLYWAHTLMAMYWRVWKLADMGDTFAGPSNPQKFRALWDKRKSAPESLFDVEWFVSYLDDPTTNFRDDGPSLKWTGEGDDYAFMSSFAVHKLLALSAYIALVGLSRTLREKKYFDREIWLDFAAKHEKSRQ